MTRQWPEIQRIVMDRFNDQSPLFSRMRDILRRYDGDYIIPIPEQVNEPMMPQLTPMTIAQTVDFYALRAGSITPNVRCPPLRQNALLGTGSADYAMRRQRYISAVYAFSKFGLSRRRSLRHLAAYHTYCHMVIPDFVANMPRIESRDPLAVVTDARAQDNFREPEWIATITGYSGAWFRAKFPDLCGERGGPISKYDPEQMWYMVEFGDAEQIVFGLLGPQHSTGLHIENQMMQQGQPMNRLISRYENKAGMVPGVMPVNMSLGTMASGLSKMIGALDLQAKLTALDILAQQRSIFPDMYVLGREGAQPRLISGDWKPGVSGEVNLVADAQSVGLLHHTPDQRTTQIIDRIERNVNTTVGLVPQAQGETYGALRTGRGVDALAGIAVDPTVQEMHEIDAAWLSYSNKVILATAKGYFGSKKFSGFSGWSGDEAQFEILPEKHIETYDNVVVYPIPGADITQTTQIQGSLYGANIISADTFREGHPWIKDASREKQQISIESIDRATHQALEQQMASGQIPLGMIGKIVKKRQAGMEIWDAIDEAEKELQQQQAALAAQQAQQQPAQPAPPEMMPGLAAGPSALMPGGQPQPPPAEEPDLVGGKVTPQTDVTAMNRLLTAMNGRPR